MSVWRERSRRKIAEVHASLPVDATIAQRRKALRAVGWMVHENTCWGRKMWGQEVRKYLEKHGLAQLAQLPKDAPLFPDHVHFPFREGPGA